MDQTVSWDEHLAFLERQVVGAEWEKWGFQDSKRAQHPQPTGDPYHALRYLQGFLAGKEKLIMDEVSHATKRTTGIP